MAQLKNFPLKKNSSLVTLQKIESKLDEIHILKGELPMEVSDLEDEIQGLHARRHALKKRSMASQSLLNKRKKRLKRPRRW